MKTYAILGIFAIALLIGGIFFVNAQTSKTQEDTTEQTSPTCQASSCSQESNCGVLACEARIGKTCGCNKP